MNKNTARLLTYHDPAAAEKPELFPIGSRVQLRSCPVGEPGVVLRMARGRVEVQWPQFNFTGRYSPHRLVLVAAASDQEGPAEAPESPVGASPGSR